ncbi:MAG TPA: hypothetical protein VLV15_16670 [Dongiaceae bacterium]|nr:hypothetical protein [Dongiaceae bacterium]
MFQFDPDTLIPLMALSIPIVAIVGGITAGIVRMMQRQRAFEMLQRERIAAIERGLDPDKIASLQRPLIYDDHGLYSDPAVAAAHRRQGLMIGGIVTLFVGIAISIFLYGVVGGHDGDDGRVWTVGLIPAAVGVALLLSSFLIRPVGPSSPPPSGDR